MKQNFEKILWFLIPIGLIIFFQDILSFDFINLDDPGYVVENAFVNHGLSWDGLRWAFSTTHMGHWHPITWISHMLDVSLFGLDPFGHHLMNLLLHSLNTLWVFLLLRRLSFDVSLSLIGALFFGLHPMRLESVVWITERKDVLSTFFGLLTILIYTWSDFRLKSKLWWWVALLASYALSLLAKPTFVTLPFLLLLIEPSTSTISIRLKRIGALVTLASIFSAIVLFSQRQAGALKTFSVLERLENGFVSMGAYWGKFFFPFETSIFYPWHSSTPGIASGIFMGLLASTILCFHARQRNPHIWFGWLWFLIAALPLSGFVQIGGQIFADRWTMLPHMGLIIVGLSALRQLEWPERRTQLVGYGFVFFVSAISWWQMPAWRNTETIFRHALETSPDNFMAHTNLGSFLDQKGNLAEAALHYEAAIRLQPEYAEALNNLGSLRARQGRLSEAIPLFEKSLARDPSISSAHYNLGLAYVSSGRIYDGLVVWLQLLLKDPQYSMTRSSFLEVIGQRLGNCDESDRATAFRNIWMQNHSQVSKILALDNPNLIKSLDQFAQCSLNSSSAVH